MADDFSQQLDEAFGYQKKITPSTGEFAAGLDATLGNPEWVNDRIPAEQRFGGFLRAHAATVPTEGGPDEQRVFGRTYNYNAEQEQKSEADVLAKAKRLFPGLDENQAKQQFRLERAHVRQAGQKEDNIEFVARSVLPGNSIGNTARTYRYGDAIKRFNEGNASQDDIEVIARYERLQQIEGKETTGQSTFRAVAGVPGMVGEAYLGGAAVRGLPLVAKAGQGLAPRAGLALTRNAVQTAAMPSMYLQQGAQNQLANPNESTFQSYTPAVVLGMTQTAVLGQLSSRFGNVPTVAGRLGARTGLGLAEMQGINTTLTGLDRAVKDVTGSTLGLDMKGGTLGSLMREDPDAYKHAFVETVTFGAFSLMHGGSPKKIQDAFKSSLDAGVKPADLVDAVKPVKDHLAENKVPDPEVLKKIVEDAPKETKPFVEAVVEAVKPKESVAPEPPQVELNRGESAPPKPVETTPPPVPADPRVQLAEVTKLRDASDVRLAEAERAVKAAGERAGMLGAGANAKAAHDAAQKEFTAAKKERKAIQRQLNDLRDAMMRMPAIPETAPAGPQAGKPAEPPAGTPEPEIGQQAKRGKLGVRPAEVRVAPAEGKVGKYDRHAILGADGKEIAHAEVWLDEADKLHINWLGLKGQGAGQSQRQLGEGHVRSVMQQLAAQYPQAWAVTGLRAAGPSKGKRWTMSMDRFREQSPQVELNRPEPPRVPFGKPREGPQPAEPVVPPPMPVKRSLRDALANPNKAPLPAEGQSVEIPGAHRVPETIEPATPTPIEPTVPYSLEHDLRGRVVESKSLTGKQKAVIDAMLSGRSIADIKDAGISRSPDRERDLALKKLRAEDPKWAKYATMEDALKDVGLENAKGRVNPDLPKMDRSQKGQESKTFVDDVAGGGKPHVSLGDAAQREAELAQAEVNEKYSAKEYKKLEALLKKEIKNAKLEDRPISQAVLDHIAEQRAKIAARTAKPVTAPRDAGQQPEPVPNGPPEALAGRPAGRSPAPAAPELLAARIKEAIRQIGEHWQNVSIADSRELTRQFEALSKAERKKVTKVVGEDVHAGLNRLHNTMGAMESRDLSHASKYDVLNWTPEPEMPKELQPAGDAGFDFGKPLTPEEKTMGSIGGGSGEGEGGAPIQPPMKDTALANARVDAERAEHQLPPLMAAARRANPAVWDAAMAKLAADPTAAARLVDELAAKTRATTVDENALLLHRRIALNNEYDRTIRRALKASMDERIARSKGQPFDSAAFERLATQADELLAMIDRVDQVTRSTGTEWGRAGQFRRQLAKEDYSLGRMMGQATIAKRKPLTAEEMATIQKQHEDITKADKALDDAENGVKPAKPAGQPGDMTDLKVRSKRTRKAYDDTLAAFKRANRPIHVKVLHGGLETANAVRSFITAFDLSAVFRQGGLLTFAHPFKAARAFADSLKSFASEHHFERSQQQLADRPNAVSGLYKDSDLYLADHSGGPTAQEEAFIGRWVGKIPGVAASARAYTGFLNRMRADVFDSMAASLPRDGVATHSEAKAIANFINVATGRGKLPGRLDQAAGTLAQLFFSPRYVASRFQILAGQPFYSGTMRTRGKIAGEFARTLAGIGVFYATVKALDDQAELTFDPRSADFGKVKMGPARIDSLTGLSQAAVFGTRLVSGEFKSSQTGKITPLRGPDVPFGGQTVQDVVSRFLRSKLAPVPGLMMDVATGQNVVGEPVTWGKAAGQVTVPISVRDVFEAMTEQGMPRSFAMSLLAILGMSTQVYDPKVKQTALQKKKAAEENPPILPVFPRSQLTPVKRLGGR